MVPGQGNFPRTVLWERARQARRVFAVTVVRRELVGFADFAVVDSLARRRIYHVMCLVMLHRHVTVRGSKTHWVDYRAVFLWATEMLILLRIQPARLA